MVEGIAVKLLATGVVKGGMEAKRRFVRHLQQGRYSGELRPVAAAFNSTLEEELREVAEVSGNDELASIAQNWDMFAPQLDTTDVLVESEEEAVDRIVSVVLGMGDVELRQTTVDELEDAVVSAYRAAIRTFQERTAHTELGEDLRHELGLDVARGVEESLGRLAGISVRLDGLVEAELKNQGFERLSRRYFDRRRPRDDPAVCWLSGFDLVDVRAGYAFDRTYEPRTNGRRSVTATFTEKLRDGNDLVVLGHPGAGKSTICRQVAADWFENRYGTVLYRPTDTPNPFTTTGTVEEYIDAADGEVLVVVENAVGAVAEGTAALVERFEASDDVSFLLEIPRSEWEPAVPERGVRDLRRMGFVEEDVPGIDESEIDRIIDHFETTSGRRVPLTPGELRREIDTVEGIGEMYLLSYRIASHALDPADIGTEGGFGFYTDVIDSYTGVADTTDDLPAAVGLMINLLNASGIGVYPELVHSLASDDETHDRIDEVLDGLEGGILFDQVGDTYRTHHPFWSVLYLKHAFVADDRRATNRLETCINALFALVDDGDRRDRIRRWLHADPPYFERISADPRGIADELIARVFKLGRDYPILASLFGSSEFSRIELPEVCSETREYDTVIWRGQMYLARGKMTAAEKEFSRLNELVADTEGPDPTASEYYEAVSLYNLGLIGLTGQGSHTVDPYEYLDRGRELFEALGEDRDEPEYFDEIPEYVDVSGHKSPGYHLTTFGQVGHSDAFEEAQKILDLIGHTEAMYVPEDETKLAVIENREKAREARQRGDWDDAEEFLRESRRAFYRAHGKRDRLRETALRELPLGGFLDRHRHETFLQADAIYLNDLGELALKRDRADLEAAESYFRRSLDLSRETGFRNGEALSLANLGRIESRRGASETACEHFQSAAEIFRGTGSVPDALDTIEGLIETCGDGENQRVAREWCRIAIALALETGLDEAAREFVDLREQL